MNNPFEFIQAMQNPQMFIQNLARNPQFMNNPMLKNAIEMSNRGDYQGIERLARNICKERNIDADEAFDQIKRKLSVR